MRHLIPISLLLLVTLGGCEQKTETPKPEKTGPAAAAVELKPPVPLPLFQEAITAERFELPSEALQVWRHTAGARPALVLFSIHPFLDPIDEERTADVAELIRSGSRDDFRQRGSYYRLNPALLPSQAVSAAIDNGLVSELVWVIPTRVGIEELSLDIFRQQVVDADFLTEEEGTSLSQADGVISGTLRGIPFRAVHPDALPELAEPVLVHIDTGYFKGLFKNEVATPLFDILHRTVMRISQAEWKAYAVTLSYSTEELTFSLDVRFLVSALARIVADPALLRQMPRQWKLHADAMYLGNMYMESKSRDLIEEAAVTAPDDPAIVYALSQVRLQQGRTDEGFALLDKAVQLDPGYASAYVQMAETGVRNGQLDKALELIRKATAVYPENPFLPLNEADILIRIEKTGEALKIIRAAQERPWSAFFHSRVGDDLKNMEAFARNPQPAGTPAADGEKN